MSLEMNSLQRVVVSLCKLHPATKIFLRPRDRPDTAFLRLILARVVAQTEPARPGQGGGWHRAPLASPFPATIALRIIARMKTKRRRVTAAQFKRERAFEREQRERELMQLGAFSYREGRQGGRRPHDDLVSEIQERIGLTPS